MTTQRSNTIQISRGTFAASLLATAVIGIGIGEVASPLASSQAHPIARAAAAPQACDTFAVSVGNAFQILGTILEDASKYPPLIPEAVTGRPAEEHEQGRLDHLEAERDQRDGPIARPHASPR